MAQVAREPLNRRRILEAAVRVVDEEGLAALSMRRLGQALGVEAMSLYHHVPNKHALLAGIVETILSELAVPPAHAGDWAERAREVARAYRHLAHAHPNAFPLMVTGEFKTPESMRLLDAMLDICRDACCDEATALDAFCTLASYTSGFALFEIGGFFVLAADEVADRSGAHGRPAEGPCAQLFDHDDAQFEFGLEAVLKGLQAKVGGEGRATSGTPAGTAP